MDSKLLANLMQKDLKNFKDKPLEEQKQIAKENLIKIGLIDENGNITDNYPHLKEYNERNKPNYDDRI